IREISQREGVSVFMNLLAVFNTLLGRYCGTTDVSVGTPSATRNHTDLEGVIGLFVNTLVLRTDLSGNPTFRELVRRVRQVVLDAETHRNVPFEKIVDEVAPRRDLARSPLFQVFMVMQNTPRIEAAMPELHLAQFPVGQEVSKFDLSLYANDSGNRIAG